MNAVDANRLIVYGAPSSQPSRAVVWTCLMQGLPFELRVPDLAEMRGGELARHNPRAQVPTIVDGDFALYEMPAILLYLCEKHGWEALYPGDLRQRARLHQYLHFHHNSTRLATLKLMAPHVTRAFRELLEERMLSTRAAEESVEMQRDVLAVTLRDPEPLVAGHRSVATLCGILEQTGLADDAFLAGTSSATIADIACYEELAQLRWANLFDFGPWPRLSRWLEAMEALPGHDAVHRYNLSLGDIRTEPITLARYLEANSDALAALEERGVEILSAAKPQ